MSGMSSILGIPPAASRLLAQRAGIERGTAFRESSVPAAVPFFISFRLVGRERVPVEHGCLSMLLISLV